MLAGYPVPSRPLQYNVLNAGFVPWGNKYILGGMMVQPTKFIYILFD